MPKVLATAAFGVYVAGMLSVELGAASVVVCSVLGGWDDVPVAEVMVASAEDVLSMLEVGARVVSDDMIGVEVEPPPIESGRFTSTPYAVHSTSANSTTSGGAVNIRMAQQRVFIHEPVCSAGVQSRGICSTKPSMKFWSAQIQAMSVKPHPEALMASRMGCCWNGVSL